jgi:protein TonB
MKNRNNKSFAVTLCAAALLHAGALAMVPDISRRMEDKPAKTPVQVNLSFPREAMTLPPPPPEPEQAEAKEPPPRMPEAEPAAVFPADPGPAESDSAQEAAQERGFPAEPDSAGEAGAGEARGFSAEPAAVVTGTSGAFDPKTRANLLLRYEASIRLLIDKHKEYPYQARRQDQEGTVEISFVLSRQGQLMEEPVLGKKTRYRLLNNAALEAVKKAVPYPPFPPEFPEEKMAFLIILAFSLTGNTF